MNRISWRMVNHVPNAVRSLDYLKFGTLYDFSFHQFAVRKLYQGRLTINNRSTQREFQLKFSALQKDVDLKYIENSKK